MKIECYVTAAPRQECKLAQCLSSLCDAGFNPHVFSEPGTTFLPEYPQATWSSKKGCWHNWKSATLAMLTLDADAYLYVQDDIIIHPESKRFILKCLWPSKDCGFISLYCPSHYARTYDGSGTSVLKPPGLFQMQVPSMYGACALLFPRKVLAQAVKTKIFEDWIGLPPQANAIIEIQKRLDDPTLIKHLDGAITRIMGELGKELWYLTPSLSQHISKFSSLNHADPYLVSCPNCKHKVFADEPVKCPKCYREVLPRRLAHPVFPFDKPITIPLPENIQGIE